MYPPRGLVVLARLPMQLLEVAARLHPEVTPAVAASAREGGCDDAIAFLSLQEFLLNHVITPAVIDAHKTLARMVQEIRPGQEARVSHEVQLLIIKQVASFAAGVCKLAGEYAPDSNPYAALVADEFITGYATVDRVLHF